MSDKEIAAAGKGPRVNDADFVSTWTEIALSGGTVADVASKLGLKPASISVRATTLRKALREQTGVELPKMRRRARTPKDFSALAALVQQKQKAIEALAAADEADVAELKLDDDVE